MNTVKKTVVFDFDGDSKSLLSKIEKFKPWNKW